MRMVFALVVALVASPAFGETRAAGAVTVAPNGAVEIAGAPCDALVPGADYVAGVDVAGNAVAPADLAHAPSPVTANTIPIEIGSNLAGQFGIPTTGGAYRAKAVLGYVTVRDGTAYFNGAPLAADASAAVTAACRAQRK
jgi:hypothetical protein